MTLYHQSVANHLTVESENEIVFDVGKSSGYLAHDEQFITISKDSVPKVQIIDILNN